MHPTARNTTRPDDPAPRRPRRRRRPAVTRLLGLLALAGVTALAGCGGSATPTATGDDDPATTTVVSADTAGPSGPTTTRVAAAPAPTLVARPTTAVDVSAEPGGPTSQVLPATTEHGAPRALVVLDQGDGWLQVALPTRPNGSTGFIRAEGIELRRVDLAVHVSLAERRLTVLDEGRVVVDSPVAVGAAATPTPVGEFYVTDKLVTDAPDGPYGPFALGLSAHSEVLTEFAGGDGQVGIHGTADPTSIGQPVSNGCIRVPNDVAVALNDLLPLGTPVVVA